MTTEAPMPTETGFELSEAVLEQILRPDDVLAVEFLDGEIKSAEANPDTDPEELTLLRFQRQLMDVDPDEADFLARDFAATTGKYATEHHTFGHRPPKLRYEISRHNFVPNFADAQRWQIVGVDPLQTGDTPLNRSVKKGVEQAWREIGEARQAAIEAQVTETRATGEVTRWLFDLTHSTER